MRNKKPCLRLQLVSLTLGVTLLLTTANAVAQQEKVLHSFLYDGKDGNGPAASLVFDASGNLYGTTLWGGAFGGAKYTGGTVFELAPQLGGGWTEKVLHSFGDATDGDFVFGGLLIDSSGNLYGTTALGGTVGYGTVFKLSPASGGGWAETILYNFGSDSKDGQSPYAGLIFDTSGNLYGATAYGGEHASGTVFELTPSVGGIWTEKVLHSFGQNMDGQNPYASLIAAPTGKLYGTTEFGGAFSHGTVFEITPLSGGGWAERVVHSFGDGADGINPLASLIFDTAGNLYGATPLGGAHNYGTTFELKREAGGGWSEKILYSFGETSTDGTRTGGVTFDGSGNMYGVTSDGGSYGYGTAFELTPAEDGTWRETVLHNFNNNGRDSFYPAAPVILDRAGNLYGTTGTGGAFYWGAVFEIKP
jgi:uncharacterized repeat protein (TIGR03803 family)